MNRFSMSTPRSSGMDPGMPPRWKLVNRTISRPMVAMKPAAAPARIRLTRRRRFLTCASASTATRITIEGISTRIPSVDSGA